MRSVRPNPGVQWTRSAALRSPLTPDVRRRPLITMKTVVLDALLGSAYPEATFHDSELTGFTLSYSDAAASLHFRIPVGLAERELVYQAGVLALSGLLFVAFDPPAAPTHEWARSPLWITSDGPFPNPTLKTSIRLPDDLPQSCFCHYLYAGNTNSFLVIAAEKVSFSWQPSAPRK